MEDNVAQGLLNYFQSVPTPLLWPGTFLVAALWVLYKFWSNKDNPQDPTDPQWIWLLAGVVVIALVVTVPAYLSAKSHCEQLNEKVKQASPLPERSLTDILQNRPPSILNIPRAKALSEYRSEGCDKLPGVPVAGS
jgi:hypothetical protein